MRIIEWFILPLETNKVFLSSFQFETFSDLVEMFEAIGILRLDLLEVVVIDETRLDASFDHIEVRFFQGGRDIRFGIDLFHFLVDDTRLE